MMKQKNTETVGHECELWARQKCLVLSANGKASGIRTREDTNGCSQAGTELLLPLTKEVNVL
jgi:hypothetical protein